MLRPRWWVGLALLALGCEEGPPPALAPPSSPGTVAPVEVQFEPLAPAIQRLTRSQYANTVHDLFGADLVIPSALEPDVAQAGFFTVGASRTTISPRGVEQYEAAAFDLARQAVRPENRGWLPCTPAGAEDADCFATIIESKGRLAWRRPLSDTEVSGAVELMATAARELDDPFEGVVFGVARLLQSPDFLFRSELGEAADDGRRYTSLEMASRLAFFLWNTAPDDALLAAGEAGELVTDEGLRAQAERMLADPRARDALRNFFTEHYGLHALSDLVKDPTVFLEASPELGPAAREETLRSIEHIVFDADTDFRTLLTTRTTFVNRRLAALYDVAAPSEDDFAQVELPADGPRAGLLGQASILNLKAHAVSSSATMRGLFIRKALLCDTVPPPPANVDTSLPEPNPDAPTLRDRLKPHRESPTCAACHALLDPIGLGLEQFDGIGRYRTTEAGATIDPSGELDGVPFPDALGLAEALAEDARIGPCLVTRLYRYATGHEETPGEAGVLDALAQGFAADGHRVQGLLLALVMSEGFRRVGALDEEGGE